MIDRRKDLQDVEAWMHFYAPEPLKTKLQTVVDMAKDSDAIHELVRSNSLASDGWEMIEAGFREEQSDESQ